MKAHLMYSDRDAPTALPSQTEALRADLDLDTIVAAMAGDDPFLGPVALAALANPVSDAATVAYRQEVLTDCVNQPEAVREIYALATDTIEAERQIWRSVFSDYPEAILRRALSALDLYIGALAKLRRTADANARLFRSAGFTTLFAMLTDQLDDAYLDTLRAHAKTLEFKRGVAVSARLGSGLKGTAYTLRSPHDQRTRLPHFGGPPHYTVTIADRDEAGARSLAALRARGVDQAANALAQATEHIAAFWAMLRAEVGFYVGCLNLHSRASDLGLPLCMPVVTHEPGFAAQGIYDMCLALHMGTPAVGNDIDTGGTLLTVITGANRGGKSTLLRATGLAQLMAQAGMFAPATHLRTAAGSGVFTHFKREEDPGMEAGKLDEELRRMSDLADLITPRATVLLNESLAATDEREGSAIARHVIDALVDSGVRVFCVTHLYDLAAGLRRDRPDAVFLRAERGSGGIRPYTVLPGDPLPTSFGEDIFRQVFGAPGDAPTSTAMGEG